MVTPVNSALVDQSWLEPTWVPSSNDQARTGEFPFDDLIDLGDSYIAPDPVLPPPHATRPVSATSAGTQTPVQIIEEHGMSQNQVALLRSRLTAAAWVLLSAMSLLFVWQVVSFEPSPPWLRSSLLVLMLGAVVLLTGRRVLSETQLRLIELAMFGVVGVQVTTTQVGWLTRAAAAQDAVALMWTFGVGTLAFAVVMLSYGMFMPNSWRRTAAMLVVPAMMPVVTVGMLRWSRPFIAEIIPPLLLWETAAIQCVVLAIAVYGTHIIATLRQEVRQAKRFGQYRLKGRIGQGGMGQVYLAEHRLLKRPCAIKLIRPNQVSDPQSLIRFEREVQTTARLSHWNTIEIYDYGRTEDGTFYYVMEYLPGLNLADLVRRFGPMCPARVIHFLKQTCAALEEAHMAGLIHRDLKPANIFASQRGGMYDVTKLLDFGLVVNDARSDLLLSNDVRRIGPFAGSPLYMAPEQGSSDSPLDARSDLYSLGATGYFLLTGRPPFEGTSPLRLMIAHAREPVTPPSHWNHAIPEDLERIILKCLEKSPSQRFGSAKQLREALNRCQDASGWTFESAHRWWHEQVNRDPLADEHPLPRDHDHSFAL
uniref:Serine/threonine protein kinase n=1 Tax=Schlesneria paludicola TaxID=360056 RepID=A0A7C2K0B4_9PLAN